MAGAGGGSGVVNIVGSASTLYSNNWGPNTGPTITATAGGGSCTYSGGSGWSCTSDERLKTHIANLRSESGLDAITRLRPVSYDLKRNGDAGSQMGFLAQEVRAIFPQAVSLDRDAKSQTAPDGTYPLNYTALIPPAVLAQQLDTRTTAEQEQPRSLRAANHQQAAEIQKLREEVLLLERRMPSKTADN